MCRTAEVRPKNRSGIGLSCQLGRILALGMVTVNLDRVGGVMLANVFTEKADAWSAPTATSLPQRSMSGSA
jgi:hypothetical protein